MISRTLCLQADQQDPLAHFKNDFELPENIIYLDGNSLGPLPKTAKARALEVIEQEWGTGLIRSWNAANWFELPARLGDKLSTLIGAKPTEVIITDTLSLNVFKVVAAALRIQDRNDSKRRVIVSEKEMFPTDLYMVQGIIDFVKQGYELRLIDEHCTLEQALAPNDVAVLLLSHVNYRSGSLWDMKKTTQQAHEKGVLTVWDLAHSAGAVEIDVTEAQADFAVGCTYKYLNGGPGSPAFVWVSPKHYDQFWQPLSGWWGHKNPFQMAPEYDPAQGIKQFLCGTQPIVSLSLIECGLDISLAAGMSAIRKKSLALTDLLIELVETRCAGFNLTLATPRTHADRGSHVSFCHPHGFAIVQALIERGVIGDYREPEIIRLGITPLYNSFTDIWDAVDILHDILKTASWDQAKFHKRGAVT